MIKDAADKYEPSVVARYAVDVAQAFNTFGALAIAAETYGLQGAVSLRVIQNVFGVVFALAFCVIFYWFMSKKRKVR